MGGVCYMNATLQCFFYCKPLTEYFLNLYDKRNLGPISKGYFDFIKGLSSENKDAAQNFKKAMIKMDDIFFGTEGNDSKDVAILILSELHKELKKDKNDELINLDRKVNNYDLNDVYKEKKELDIINGNNTIITKTFNFCMKYKQQCGQGPKCIKFSNPYYTIETDNILILDLETLFVHDNINISVKDILKSYTSPKKLECPYCKTKSLYMQNKFCVLPKILILVLSRGYHNKFKCHIKFDETLDMNEYYESIDNEDDYSNVYSLIGATFAYDWSYEGTGHTVAFCKTYQNGNYYVFNDSTARKTQINEIYGKLPYLLFYEREI
jgi:ubiquitin C-terminal hydrolase